MNEFLNKYFGVVIKGQTYLNLLYLLLAFPLGVFYFVYLVTGISVGIGLSILWIGLLILLLVIGGWWLLAAFERQMAVLMLRKQIPPMLRDKDRSANGIWAKFTAFLGNPVTWKSLLYLFVKFPLGIISFVVVVTFGSIIMAFIAAPFYYNFINPEVWITSYTIWRIDTLWEAIIACLAGILLLPAALHAFNGIAWVSGEFARVMLGNTQQPAVNLQPAEAVVPAPEPISVKTAEMSESQVGEKVDQPGSATE